MSLERGKRAAVLWCVVWLSGCGLADWRAPVMPLDVSIESSPVMSQGESVAAERIALTGGELSAVAQQDVALDSPAVPIHLDIAMRGAPMDILRAIILGIPDWQVVVTGAGSAEPVSVDVQLRTRGDLWRLIARLGCTVRKSAAWHDVVCGVGRSGEGESESGSMVTSPIDSRLVYRLGPGRAALTVALGVSYGVACETVEDTSVVVCEVPAGVDWRGWVQLVEAVSADPYVELARGAVQALEPIVSAMDSDARVSEVDDDAALVSGRRVEVERVLGFWRRSLVEECLHVPVPVPGEEYREAVTELVRRVAGGVLCGEPFGVPGGVVVSVQSGSVDRVAFARRVLGVLEPGRVVLVWRVRLEDLGLSLSEPAVQLAERTYRVVYGGGAVEWAVDTQDTVSGGAQVIEGRPGVVDVRQGRSYGVELAFDGAVMNGAAIGRARWADRAAVDGGTSGVQCVADLRVFERESLVCEYGIDGVTAGLVFEGLKLGGVELGATRYRYLVTVAVDGD